MQAILFADRKPFGSDPISQQYCPAMLPLGGRPAIVHSIEDLAEAGFTKIYLVISSQAYQIESLLMDGTRWGVEIEYLLSQGEEKPSEIIKRNSNIFETPLLLVRGDMIRSACINEFIQSTADRQQHAIACFDDHPAGMLLCRNNLQDEIIDSLEWSALTGNTYGSHSAIQLTGKSLSYLEDLNDFFNTASSLCSDDFTHIKPLGLKDPSGLIHGRNKKISPRATINGRAWLGNNVCIEHDVEISGIVTVGDDVLIDSGARLHNCMIMPGTYLGKGVNLENCILSKNHLYRMDMDMDMPIADNFLAAALSSPTMSVMDRFLALALLIASLPLWIYAAILTTINSPRELFKSVSIHSNKSPNDTESLQPLTVSALDWNLSVPLLRRLPWLLNVIKGDIRLIGTDPVCRARPFEDQLFQLSTQSYGLLSASQVDLNKNVPQLEKIINDFVYDRQRNVITDFRYLIAFTRCLFKPHNWRKQSALYSTNL